MKAEISKVIYLFGAGASESVLKSLNHYSGLLTGDIQNLIASKYSPKGINANIWNEIIKRGNDIEHLISVLESNHNYSASNKIRKYYRDAIVQISKDISANPPFNLYSVLIDMHINSKKINEELLCIVTLNYEDILEQTIKSQFGLGVDYVIHSFKDKQENHKKIKVFKLHGSFNWLNTRPVRVKKMTTIKPEDTLWIPPGVDKKKDNYPFNILWGHFSEQLLRCDILRIVGCSLSRNDWGLIPILYTLQKFNENNSKGFRLEIIDYPKTCENIKNNYKYLNVIELTEINEFIYFYKKQFPAANTDEVLKEIKAKYADFDKANPFEDWLYSKVDYLQEKLEDDLITTNKFLYKFYNKEYD